MEETFAFKRPDTYRQTLEAEQMKANRVFDSFCIEASKKVNSFFTEKLNCSSSRVVKYSHKLVAEDASKIDGDINYTVSVEHGNELKTVDVPVKVTNNEAILPEETVMASVLSSASSLRVTASLKVSEEIQANIKRINEFETYKQEEFEKTLASTSIQRTAASVTSPADQLAPNLKINKDFLPSGVKVGDVLYVDAAQYRIVSGDDDKLNSEGSGVYWTLSRVLDVLGKDEKVINVQDKF